jgi:hypothetical protein
VTNVNQVAFTFPTDDESEAFCAEILREMQERFGISQQEAVGRMNRFWWGLSLIGPNHPIYHESPEYFAKTIYYGPDTAWWKGEAGLTPQPYP